MNGVAIRRVVGREEEAERILGLLGARDRLPAVAALVGEAGIGKSTLWLAGADAAEAIGYRVLSCRPSEAETRFSFSGLTDLIGDVVDPILSELPPVQRRALEVALLLGESQRPANKRVIAAAVLSTLKLLSRGAPLLVAVDDVQWLDTASLATLQFALPRLRSEPVAALLAARGDVPDWLRRGFDEERMLAIELGPLSLGAVHELLRARLHATFSRPMLRRVWEVSAGNPFFALELARALQRRGGAVEPGAELPIPASLDALVHERVEGLSASALEVARVVAALADPTAALVETAVGRAAEQGLEDAFTSGVLELDGERLGFTHPLLASAVSSRASSMRRRSLHARLANLVPTTEERARHLALATNDPSREIASLLEEGAHTARARGAPAAAAELTEQALRLTPAEDAEDARRRTLAAADRHHEAGDGGRAIAVLEQALAAAPPGTERARLLVHLAAVKREVVVDYREAVALLYEALDEAEGDDALEATIHLSLADLWRVATDAQEGLAHAEIAVHAARRVGDAALTCRALAVYGLLHFTVGLGTPGEEMEEALALERSLPGWPLADAATRVVAHQLVFSCEFERGRRHLEAWREALSARDDSAEAEALWYLSLLELRAGHWELAAHYAADSLALRAQFGYVGAQGPAELPAAALAAHRGEIADARARSERALALADASGVQIAQSGHRWVLGFIELSLGNAAAALVYLRRGWEIRDEIRILEPGHRLELADTLEALIAVGELDEAERLLVPWEERSRALDRAWALAILARCRALVLAARGDFAGASASFERALAEHARIEDPFQHARTLLALGAMQRRVKQRGAARETLEQALGIFEQLGAPLWAEKARAELARIGGRAPSRGGLTEGERRIATLVAEGHTNREVAAALFLTEHTVETVLSRAYRKLGVHSRGELTRLLVRETQEGT